MNQKKIEKIKHTLHWEKKLFGFDRCATSTLKNRASKIYVGQPTL